MSRLILFGLFFLALFSCNKNAKKPEFEENISFEINTASSVVHMNSDYAFQVLIKSKIPSTGIKVTVSAVQEVTGDIVTPQLAAVVSTSSTLNSSVKNLPRQKWVVVTVGVSSVANSLNASTKTFRIVYK